MEDFPCLSNYVVGTTYYYTKGKTYKGTRQPDGSVEIVGNAHFIKQTFHRGNPHFAI